MASARSSRKSRAKRGRRALLDALDAAETRRVLVALLDAHPELVAEATALAEAQLGEVTVEDVAEDVGFALGQLQVEDIWQRAGTQPDGEYVDPTDAAWELVEEAAAPFFEDLERRLGLGRSAEAMAVCQGILLGLYRLSRKRQKSSSTATRPTRSRRLRQGLSRSGRRRARQEHGRGRESRDGRRCAGSCRMRFPSGDRS